MRTLLTLFFIILVLDFMVGFYLGVNHEIRNSEQAIELAFDAAAQQYKTDYENDTSRFDYYGNQRLPERTNSPVLPQNERTKNANWKASKTKESKTTRKRTF